jgi:hypothetical protein
VPTVSATLAAMAPKKDRVTKVKKAVIIGLSWVGGALSMNAL